MIQDSRIMNETKIKEFTDLLVWQEGHKLVVQIYKITKGLPKEETYSLIDQMRRAATSITSNIAEGFGRHSYKEKIQFYYLSQGSLLELKNQIYIAKDVGYLDQQAEHEILVQINITHKLLQEIITKSKTFLNHKS